MIPTVAYGLAKVVGTVVIGTTSAVCAGMMAVPTVIIVQEGVKEVTRDQKGLGGYIRVIEKLDRLRETALPKALRDHVVENYKLKSSMLNYIGAGSSKSSRTLLSDIQATNRTKTLYALFHAYLCNSNSGSCQNDGKEMCMLIANFIRDY